MTFPVAPLDDRGLLLGDGLFETVLSENGRLVLMEAHVDRLRAGAAVLGLPAPSGEAVVAAARTALAAAGLGEGRAAVRVTLTAGSGGRGLDRPEPMSPRLFATAAPAPRAAGPVSLARVDIRRNETSPASRLKTLAYLDNVLARRQAQAAGADDALMLNTRGELACGAVANLFWITQGRLFTPALECGVLAGVMRAEVLARADGLAVAEVHAGPEALDAAEGVFLTSSLIGVRQVSRVGDRAYGSHPMAAALADSLADVS